MKISFNTWVYAGWPGWMPLRGLDDVIDELAELGYDGIEIGGAAPHGYPPYLDDARRAALRQRLADRGLEAAAILPAIGGGPGGNPVSPDDAERRWASEYTAACVGLAADIGCPTVVWLGGIRRFGQTQREAWALGVESLKACAEVAAERGVRLAVEPTPQDSNVIEEASDALQLLEDAGVGPDVGGVMLDTAHIMARNDEIRDSIRSAGDRLIHFHLAEVNRDAPGTQHDFTSVIEALREVEYPGWLSMEIAFNRREYDPRGVARKALAHIRGLLDA